VFTDNWVHDNNNPNVPASGSAAAGPVGTGMSISGGRNDTITGNRFERNGAWGTILVPYPDMGQPCTGGTQLRAVCMYDDYGDAITNNTYAGNGFFGNPTNGDIAALNLEVDTTSCFRGNTEEGGGPLKTSPTYLQQAYPYCNGTTVMPNVNPMFLDQALCDSQSISLGPISGGTLCLPGTHYPRRATIVMHPLPKNLPTMPDPCMSVPANPWCPGGGSADLK
jgi:hypothetical protein